MTRLEVLAELAIRLQDTYKVIVSVREEYYSLRIYFSINSTYVMEINPFYIWYGAAFDNLNGCDVDCLYGRCCRTIEHQWLRFLKKEGDTIC